MKEKVKRILDLIRAGKLSLDDAAPLLAALSSKLALTEGDRDLIQALLGRAELDTGQVAEHLLLLRGVRDSPPGPPPPPRAPNFSGQWSWEGQKGSPRGLDDLGERIAAKIEQAAARFAAKAERLGVDVEDRMSQFADDIERSVDSATQGAGSGSRKYEYQSRSPSGSKVLRIEVNSEDGDSYDANLPIGLAPHLHKLIPPYGAKALEKAGFTLEALQLIIEADPPAGPIIEASDEDGNSVTISIKAR